MNVYYVSIKTFAAAKVLLYFHIFKKKEKKALLGRIFLNLSLVVGSGTLT